MRESDREVLDMAPIVAMDALSSAERDEVATRLADSGPEVAAAFDAEVCLFREVLAELSAAHTAEPSPELRSRLLDRIAHEEQEAAQPPPISLDERRRQSRRRNFLLVAAAALVVALGGVVVASQWPGASDQPTTAQVLAADDVRTTTGVLDGGGTATVVFSKEVDAGVLVMNNVAPPTEGTVYQMWLIGPEGASSAGTMTPEDVAPSTTAVLEEISGATALAFSIEPAGGSKQPTALFAELPLG
ncbi:anti-sigma factor [Rhodococcus chondri]|uniref:Regulator of SigK n=1 Tax=Rhodococcus chondri TaxID=3065941 RepID=A0ABU7JNV3_9NOCA|nr:anti-sigma factor [Rhodococcus sp. CC-R104]MEE2031716.1 anti-sigma factor [Rhodococcus sp. CC-R104]